jgi:hypothetical protein
MTQAANKHDARHRYIELLRSLNPDEVLKKRLDLIESAPKVTVTQADVRDVVVERSAHLPNVMVDAVVSELNEKLGLVGEHNMTTALRSDTVKPWIEMQIDGELGDAGFEDILQHSSRMQ